MVNVLALEPFYGGSHQSFIDGLISRSRHEYQLLTQPGCFWKWRMRGSAITMANKANHLNFVPDIILASDMLSLAEFNALYKHRVPSIIYMHENQVSYPTPASDLRDVHFGFTNITSALAANVVVWNSQFHHDSFLTSLPLFFKAMPDNRPRGLDERVKKSSVIIPPGVDLKSIDQEPIERDGGPPIIVWNHRWEFDKKPDDFFAAMDRLVKDGEDFRLCVMGENFQIQPTPFIEAKERFKHRLVQYGYVESHKKYISWLRRSSISVSVADQENFGISVVEAAYAGALPLWPDRLSYPELMSDAVGNDHLYSDFPELVLKLKTTLKHEARGDKKCKEYAAELRKYDWSEIIGRFDDLIEKTAAESKP
jgi:glycosyltransferase involved in cell wall biosynthesis